MTIRLVLDGRSFVSPQDLTFDHDLYMMPHVLACGIVDVLAVQKAGLTLTAAQRREILQRVLDSGRALDLLAGVLVEEENGRPRTWTPIEAAGTRAFLGSLRDSGSRELLQQELVNLVLSFFSSGEPSLETSTISSEPAAETEATPPHEIAGSSSSETGVA